MNRNPYKRLGAGKRGADEIKDHPFLASINWEEAMLRKLKVPEHVIRKIALADLTPYEAEEEVEQAELVFAAEKLSSATSRTGVFARLITSHRSPRRRYFRSASDYA